MDKFADDMCEENVHTVECRFVEGETVEFYSRRKWRPAKVLSINNLITDKNMDVKKYTTESLVGFDVYIKIKYTRKHKQEEANVLQTSNRLQRTNTHIHKGNPYNKKMILMMQAETKTIQKMRLERETHILTAINAVDIRIHRCRPNIDTLFARSLLKQFIRPNGKLNNKTIKSSGPDI